MYLSDRDLAWAIKTGRLIVEPPPIRAKPEPEGGPGLAARLGHRLQVLVGEVKKLPGGTDRALQFMAGEGNKILYRFLQMIAVAFLVGLMILAAYAVYVFLYS